MAIVDSAPRYPLTGAVHHYVQLVGSASTYYLGTCEVQPEVRIWELSAPVMNDNAGRILPGQKTDQGKKADIGLQLSYYSELTYDQLKKPRGVGNNFAVAEGWDGRFARGSLVFGSKTFRLWQVFERQTIAGLREANQPLGYYWPQVEMIQHAPVKLGNSEKQLLLVLEAQPEYQPQASYNAVVGNERTWALWKEDDASFPAEVLVPQ